MIAVRVVQAAIVKIVGVAIVLHGSVATFLTVLVAVFTFVFSVSCAHCLNPFLLELIDNEMLDSGSAYSTH